MVLLPRCCRSAITPVVVQFEHPASFDRINWVIWPNRADSKIETTRVLVDPRLPFPLYEVAS